MHLPILPVMFAGLTMDAENKVKYLECTTGGWSSRSSGVTFLYIKGSVSWKILSPETVLPGTCYVNINYVLAMPSTSIRFKMFQETTCTCQKPPNALAYILGKPNGDKNNRMTTFEESLWTWFVILVYTGKSPSHVPGYSEEQNM